MVNENSRLNSAAQWATVLTGVAAVFGLIFSLITISQTNQSLKEQLIADAPYLNVPDPKIIYNSLEKKWILRIEIRNYGKRPASDIRGTIKWINQSGERDRDFDFPIDPSGDIAPESHFLALPVLASGRVPVKSDLFIKISYVDKKLGKNISEEIYLKFDGTINGYEIPLAIMKMGEKEDFLKKYRNFLDV